MRVRILVVLMSLVCFNLWSNGSSDSGRQLAYDQIESGNLVAQSYIDTESFLDTYELPYTVEPGSVLSLFFDQSNTLTYTWGGESTIQVSMISNPIEAIPPREITYCIYIDDDELLDNEEILSNVGETIEDLYSDYPGFVSIYLYFPQQKSFIEYSGTVNIANFLNDLSNERIRRNRMRTFEELLIAGNGLASTSPLKILWILGKPVAETESDLTGLYNLISAYKMPDSEISFCGYNESFRPQTINPIVSEYGGNTYYISDPSDIGQIIRSDAEYYLHTAIERLKIEAFIYNYNQPRPEPVRTYGLRSIGPDEQHVFLTEVGIYQQSSYLSNYATYFKPTIDALQSDDVSFVDDALPNNRFNLCLFHIQYFDVVNNKWIFKQVELYGEYTDDFERFMSMDNPIVRRSKTILSTAAVLEQVAYRLSGRDFRRALQSLSNQIEVLTLMNRESYDPVIAEDIEYLSQYKELIIELQNDPTRNAQINSDIRRRQF